MSADALKFVDSFMKPNLSQTSTGTLYSIDLCFSPLLKKSL